MEETTEMMVKELEMGLCVCVCVCVRKLQKLFCRSFSEVLRGGSPSRPVCLFLHVEVLITYIVSILTVK